MNQLFSTQLHHFPGRNNYNPDIVFSNKETPQDDKMKNKSASKEPDLKKDPLYIILADDDEDDRELFAEAMQESGHKIKLDFAEDGKELLAILDAAEKELPHMIFLDLNMPNKSGKECLEYIRQSVRLKDIPIIIYSTSSSTQDIDETFEKGANLYISKPTSYNDLLSMAKNVLAFNWNDYLPKTSKNQFVFYRKKR